MGFEVILEGDGEAFKEWLAPYAEKLGAKILVSDDNDSYSVAAAGLGVEHQLCVAHVRKYVAKRSESIFEQARAEWGEGDEQLDRLAQDLGLAKKLVEELGEEGGRRMGRWQTDGSITLELFVGAPSRAQGREGELRL